MSGYRKLLAALAGVVAITANAMLDGVFTAPELEAIALALVAAFFVYKLPNAQPEA